MANPNLVNTNHVYTRSNVQVPISGSSFATVLDNQVLSGQNRLFRADSLVVCNITSSTAEVTVRFSDSNVSQFSDIAKNITVPGNSSIVIIDKDYPIYVPENTRITINASADSTLHALCSYTVMSDSTNAITIPTQPNIPDPAGPPPTGDLSLVSYLESGSGVNTFTIPSSSASVGDIAVYFGFSADLDQSTPSGWTRATYTENGVVEIAAYYKVLTSGDLDSAFTVGNAVGVNMFIVSPPSGTLSVVGDSNVGGQVAASPITITNTSTTSMILVGVRGTDATILYNTSETLDNTYNVDTGTTSFGGGDVRLAPMSQNFTLTPQLNGVYNSAATIIITGN